MAKPIRLGSIIVYPHCFLQYSFKNKDDLEYFENSVEKDSDHHIRIKYHDDGRIIVRVRPQKIWGMDGKIYFMMPDALSGLESRDTDWKVELHVVGEGQVTVHNGKRIIPPFWSGTTSNGLPVRKFSGPSRKLTLRYTEDGKETMLRFTVIRKYGNRVPLYDICWEKEQDEGEVLGVEEGEFEPPKPNERLAEASNEESGSEEDLIAYYREKLQDPNLDSRTREKINKVLERLAKRSVLLS